MTNIPGTPGALDRVLAEHADLFTAMLRANHAMGRYDNVEMLLHGLADRPALIPGVTLRLLNLTDPERAGEVIDDDD